PTAQYSLAVMYIYGRGVEKSDKESLKWLTLSAQQGDAMAEYALGERFRLGFGVTKDLAEAFKWYTLSAAQGVDDAAAGLKNIRPTMSGEQITDGRQRAQKFVPAPTSPDTSK